ncbi:MAG: zinc-ribbon domain-containing protein [Blastocatellia bacterium]|nr:zinc-ribbon domain-containing protein [Blastocatellia bacterium]
MYCTQCGTANSDEIRFCMNCGAPMVRRGATPKDRSSSGQSQPPYPGYSGPSAATPSSYPSSFSGQSPSPSYTAYHNDPGAQPYQLPTSEGSASSRAVISMVLSVISPFTCWVLLSLPGMILGKMEMNAIRNGQAPKAGEVFAKIGFYVGLVISILSIVILIGWPIAFLIKNIF